MSSKSNTCSPKRSGPIEKKCSATKLKKTPKGSPIDSQRPSECTEFVLFNHNFDSPGSSKRSLISTCSRAPSTSSSFGQNRKGKTSSKSLVVDNASSIPSGGSENTKLSMFPRYFKNPSQSRGSIETSSLKKIEEAPNFSFEKHESDSCRIQCGAERLKLEDKGNSVKEIPTRSNLFLSNSALNPIVVDSQESGYERREKKSQSYAPFEKNENTATGSNELVINAERGRKPQKFGSKNSFLKKSQILSFFATEEKNEPNRENNDEPEENDEERKKSSNKGKKRDMVIRYLDPPVPVEEDQEIKQNLRQMFFFCIQLAFITIISVSLVSPDMYYFTKLSTKIFFESPFPVTISVFSNGTYRNETVKKTLETATTIQDFWAFSQNILVDFLSWESNVNINTNAKMFREDKLLGEVRVRQVRVKHNSCKIHKDLNRFFNTCLASYSVFAEDTDPIREDMVYNDTAIAWVYTDSKDLQSTYYMGEMATYGGGGYYIDLPRDKSDALKLINDLEAYNWLSIATRAVFINFNLYNANVNLFCVCKIVLEFPPSGGLIAGQDFHSLKLIRYLDINDFLVLGFEIVYTVFVVYNTITELKAFNKERVSYIFSWWNILNFSHLLLSYLYIILSIVRKVYSAQLIASLDPNHKYTEFQFVKRIQLTYNDTMALLLFFTWIKLFAFLNLTKNMLQLKQTLSKSLKSMLEFLPMFIIMFLAFTFLAYLLFGCQVKFYSTVLLSFLTLLQAFLGIFHYEPIVEAHRILGPIFFVVYVFFIFFVMMNVFVAIINDAYLTVRSQVILESPKTVNYLKRAFINVFTCWKPMKEKKSRKITRKRILFNDIKNALRRAGFREEEISIFFHKYNVNSRNFLESKTKTRIMKDLELKGINFSETSEQFQIDTLRRRLDEFRERMENWEIRLQPVIDKVDILLHRL